MAANHGEAAQGLLRVDWLLLSLGLFIFAAIQTAHGPSGAILAGLSAAGAIYLIRFQADLKLSAQLFAVDFVAVALFASLVDGDGILWRAPATLLNLCQFSPIGGVSSLLVYFFGIIVLRARSQLALRFGLALIPFLFSLLISLGAPPISQLGQIFFLGFNAPEGIASLTASTED